MPRQARQVFAHIPHHITQRGNRRQTVFFSEADKVYYLKLLSDYCQKHQVAILAYCLMDNHVHLILQPSSVEGLQQVLKPLHMRYTQYINKKQNWQGLLWQGRYFSSPLDERYCYHAFRYVENNPVRAGLVAEAVNFPFSSARHHAGLEVNECITDYDMGVDRQAYAGYLAETIQPEVLALIREKAQKNLPCGEASFVEKLSGLVGKNLSGRTVGRPRKEKKGSVPI